MKYVEKYGLYVDDDLVVYRVVSRDYGSLRKGQLSQLKPYKEKSGYFRISYSIGNVKKHVAYHRLIAEAFIPNPLNLPTVDHINRNPSDNRVVNLRWATHKEQSDNTNSVDRGLSKYGVRCCEDKKAYNREYGKTRIRRKG